MPTDEANALWTAYHDGRSIAARNSLAEFYLPIVRKLAAIQFRKLPPGSLVEIDDLVAFGVQGLFNAIERFDPGRGFSFGTFAGQRVYGAIIDGLRNASHIPRRLLWQRNTSGDSCRSPDDKNRIGSLDLLFDAARDYRWDREQERRAAVESAHELVRTLPKLERLVVLLVCSGRSTLSEFARSLGMPVPTAFFLKQRAIEMIRERFRNRGDYQ